MSTRPPSHSRRVLVDTSGYFAATNRRDTNHSRGTAVLAQLIAERRPLFTTNFILAETHALLLTRVNREIAARVLFEIDKSRMTTVVRVSAADEARAREIIQRYQDKSFSLTDATSFAVMERLGIVQSFTFDVNFAQYGFAVIPDIGA
jgi:predicted nucleic acid-binding protein